MENKYPQRPSARSACNCCNALTFTSRCNAAMPSAAARAAVRVVMPTTALQVPEPRSEFRFSADTAECYESGSDVPPPPFPADVSHPIRLAIPPRFGSLPAVLGLSASRRQREPLYLPAPVCAYANTGLRRTLRTNQVMQAATRAASCPHHTRRSRSVDHKQLNGVAP